jgi:hypothetical protein
MLGSISPWATLGAFITKNGTDGGGDGTVTLVVGVGALAASLFLIARRGKRLVLDGILFVLFGLTAAVGVYDWKDVTEPVGGSSSFQIQVGWGLVVVTLMSLLGVALSLSAVVSGVAGVVRTRRRRPTNAGSVAMNSDPEADAVRLPQPEASPGAVTEAQDH